MAKQQDYIRKNSPESANLEIDQEMAENLQFYVQAGRDAVDKRIRELEREWDIERVLMLNASAFALGGLTLGVLKDKRWMILPGVVCSFLLQHAIQGWCPPVPLFRKMGVRTRKEIDTEKYALKALRGDFELRSARSGNQLALAALEAAERS